MENINDLFHRLADEGKLTAKKQVVDIDISERIAVLKQQVKRRNSIQWQRDELLRLLVRHWGLGDSRFDDFMNGFD